MMATEDFLDKIIQTCPDGIIGIDRKGTVVLFNPAAEKLTGRTAEQVIEKMSIEELYGSPQMAREVKKEIYGEGHGPHGRVEGLEITVKDTTGKRIPIRLSAALIFEGGIELGSVGFFHDMSVRKEMEEELRRSSITDSLTGLYNRRHFHTTLTEEMARSARYNGPLSLAIFDLDNFKPFNDTYGHQEGDAILRLVAQCLGSVFRSTDHAFRLGGDEFAVLLVETDLENAGQVMERFRTHFAGKWPQKMAYLGRKLRPVTISIGVSQVAGREQADKFQLRTDLAMYEAKKAGGDRMVLASEQIGL